ncbi:class I SAM-dependent methyltransferase [Cyanobium sp. Morenito 9A2]|uniref:class I SAM-dependent methyltransferase n=1 Tax=Cyanobium sp. Morenito 9A2 TaxID=2823718 RepID=UPI0020CCAF85|nr:class I SAM-dependent methyltransferase [Cyanobium sp. Morenito 9A2]MCP9849334.1 class I SAM-dependent methyltransferase [Cyanobium sp. Morenito 9A2]
MVEQPLDPLAPAGYDLVLQQLVPGYASLARLAVALLAVGPLAGETGADVLVAGCGTGAELLEAVAQRPDWRLTAIDPSAAMLQVAQGRLRHAPAIEWRCSTAESLQESGRFAGALSVLVLQSLPDDGSKLAFLTALAQSLRPGGQLVLVDLMRSSLSGLGEQVERAWLGFQRASGLTATAEQLAPLTQALHPIGAARLTALVNAAGFSDPARIFQALDVEGFLLQRRR